MEQPIPIKDVFVCLLGFVNQRYHAYQAHPDAPFFRTNIQTAAQLRETLTQAVAGTDHRYWAGCVVNSTARLMAITSSNPERKTKELDKITGCINILRGKLNRMSA